MIDDVSGVTLAAASTTEKDLKGKTGGNIKAAQAVGRAIAKRAQSAGVSQVVFDRGGYVYHGRVKALLDATREAGLNKNEGAFDAEKSSEADKTFEAENAPGSISSTVGSVVGKVTGAISNLFGGSTDATEEESAKENAQTIGDEAETRTDKINKGTNENE